MTDSSVTKEIGNNLLADVLIMLRKLDLKVPTPLAKDKVTFRLAMDYMMRELPGEWLDP